MLGRIVDFDLLSLAVELPDLDSTAGFVMVGGIFLSDDAGDTLGESVLTGLIAGLGISGLRAVDGAIVDFVCPLFPILDCVEVVGTFFARSVFSPIFLMGSGLTAEGVVDVFF